MCDVRVSAVPCVDGLQSQRLIDREGGSATSAAVADERRDGRSREESAASIRRRHYKRHKDQCHGEGEHVFLLSML
jgi:hypothetical protein